MIVVPTLTRGGAEKIASLLGKEWSSEHELTTVIFDKRDKKYDISGELIVLSNSASQKTTIKKVIVFLNRVLQLKILINKEQPEAIISFMETANFPTLFAAFLTGKRKNLVVSVRTNPNRFGFMTRILVKLFYTKAKKVVAVSEGVKDALHEVCGLSNNCLVAIPNPVIQLPKHEDIMTKCLDNKKIVRGKYIVSVGRLVREKGFDFLIKSMKLVDQKDIKLVICGEGDQRAELELLCEEEKVSDRVLLVGDVDEPEEYLRDAVLYVLSSRVEGWPNALMEAMSFGCPSIAFDCSFGPNEIIKDNINGRLVKDQDYRALGREISILLSDVEARKRYSKASVISMKNYTLEIVASKWMFLIKK